jgi:hypothetical protein
LQDDFAKVLKKSSLLQNRVLHEACWLKNHTPLRFSRAILQTRLCVVWLGTPLRDVCESTLLGSATLNNNPTNVPKGFPQFGAQPNASHPKPAKQVFNGLVEHPPPNIIRQQAAVNTEKRAENLSCTKLHCNQRSDILGVILHLILGSPRSRRAGKIFTVPFTALNAAFVSQRAPLLARHGRCF